MNRTSHPRSGLLSRPGREPYRRKAKALTLIELLVVIAIVGTLAALLLPATSRFKTKTQVQTARLEIDRIATAKIGRASCRERV